MEKVAACARCGKRAEVERGWPPQDWMTYIGWGGVPRYACEQCRTEMRFNRAKKRTFG